MLCIRPTRYEYDQNLKKKKTSTFYAKVLRQRQRVRQRFTYIFIRCHCWLKRQGVTAPSAVVFTFPRIIQHIEIKYTPHGYVLN